MLNEDDDDGCGKLRGKGLDDSGVDNRNSGVSEALGDILDDANHGVIPAVDVDTSADTGVQQDDKGSSECRNEEVELGALRLLLGHG